ncbi:neuropeptide CCHamide-2 receptor-like isoform X1 [Pectinophora gossypiella]|uniref:neuropeptide CCHamide-2 receptor-like isoform X1 n=1 Tax=Pectinophora gossypiella TaxID=13191 RepID=UPI00214E2335|nr:neuropeptide CCHamide-2 receptor-like isoform X1 [Pectinophora gossypiella]
MLKEVPTMYSLTNSTTLDENSTDSEYTPYVERLETYLVPVLFAIIFIVGVLGNGTLVIVYVRHRGMRNAPNTYIFSLALADLLVILICVPFVSVIYTLESWPWGELICRISEAAKDVSIGVSVFTLTALSAERYCAIVNPFRKLQLRKLPLVCATFIWAAALIFATPAAVFSNIVTAHLDNNITIVYCTPYPPEWENYPKWMTLAKAIIYYGLPLVVIALFYSLMAQRLLASTKEMPGALHGGQGEAQAKARKSVACMVLIFVIVFFVCFLPYHAFEMWFHLAPTAQADYNDWTHGLRIVGFCLSFLNSCVNPVALYCVSGVFRQHFNRYLCCRRGTLHPTCSSRLSRTAICETSFRSTHRHRCNSNLLKKNELLSAYNRPTAGHRPSFINRRGYGAYSTTRLHCELVETLFLNPTESVVISNYDYGSTKKKSNIISRNSTDGVTIMTIRDTNDYLTGDGEEKCINR